MTMMYSNTETHKAKANVKTHEQLMGRQERQQATWKHFFALHKSKKVKVNRDPKIKFQD